MEIHTEFTRNMIPSLPGENNALPPAQATGRAFPMFFVDDEYDEAASAELGRPFFHQREKVRVIIPGDRLSIVEKRVDEEVKNRWPQEYARFVKGQEIAESGTPIEHWPLLQRNQVATLKHFNIFTVEQLSELSDGQGPQIGMGWRTLREQAKAFLEAAEQGAVPARLVSENEKLRDQQRLDSEKIKELENRLEAVLRKMGDMGSEQLAAGVAPSAQIPEAPKARKPKLVNIPENYRELGLTKLRDICSVISAAPIKTKSDAYAIIEEHLSVAA